MDTVGTLKILIEADAVGLTSQLKRAGSSITNFVGQMNKQEVNWTQILSRTISPAIISGIAATFALAIGSALKFQAAMSNAAMQGSQDFSDNLGNAGDVVLDLSGATGVGMNDMADASALLSHYIDMTSDTFKSFSREVGAFAYAAGLDYKELLLATLPVLKDWGVKSEDMSGGVNDMISATQHGVIPLGELSSVLNKTADGLRGLVSLQDAAFFLEELSKIIPSKDAVSIFESIATAATNALDPMNLLLGGEAWVERTLNAKGIQGVLDGIVSTLGAGGTVAEQLGIKMGIPTTTLKTIVDYKGEIKNIGEEVKKAEAEMTTLDDKTQKVLTPAKKLAIEWNKVLIDMQKIAGPLGDSFISWLTSALSYIDKIFNHPWETLKNTFSSAKGIGTAGLTVGGAGAGAMTGMMTGAAIGSAVPVIGTAIGAIVGGLAGLIAGAYGGNTLAKGISNAVDNSKNQSANNQTYNDYSQNFSLASNVVGANSLQVSNNDYMKTFGILMSQKNK